MPNVSNEKKKEKEKEIKLSSPEFFTQSAQR